jgi:hypothetical protein
VGQTILCIFFVFNGDIWSIALDLFGCLFDCYDFFYARRKVENEAFAEERSLFFLGIHLLSIFSICFV